MAEFRYPQYDPNSPFSVTDAIDQAGIDDLMPCCLLISRLLRNSHPFTREHTKAFVNKFSPLCNRDHPLRRLLITRGEKGITDQINDQATKIVGTHIALLQIAFDFMQANTGKANTLGADEALDLLNEYNAQLDSIVDHFEEKLRHGFSLS